MATFFSDVVVVLRSRVIMLFTRFFAGALTARFLGPEGRGLLTALLIVPEMVASLCDMGIRQSVGHFIAKGKASMSAVLGAIGLIYIGTTLLGIGGCWVYFTYFGRDEYTWPLIILATMTIPLTIITSYITGIFLGKQEMGRFARASWLPEVLRLTALCGFIVTFGLTVSTALIATLVSLTCMVVYLIFMVRPLIDVKPSIDLEVRKKIVSMGIAFGLALFLINVNYRLSTFMLARFSYLEQIGYFAVAIPLSELVWQIPGTLSMIVFSRSAGNKNEAEFTFKTVALMRLSFLACCVAAVGVYLGCYIVIPVIYGVEFMPSLPIIGFLLPGMAFMAIFKILNVHLGGQGKPWLTMYVIIPGILLNAVLSYYLIPLYGAQGAAIGSTITYFLVATGYVFIYCKTVNIGFKDTVVLRKQDFLMVIERVPFLDKYLTRRQP